MSAYTFIIVIVLKCHTNGIYSVNRKPSIEKEKGSTAHQIELCEERQRKEAGDQVKGIRELQFVLQVWPQIKLNHFSVCDTSKDQLAERTGEREHIQRASINSSDDNGGRDGLASVWCKVPSHFYNESTKTSVCVNVGEGCRCRQTNSTLNGEHRRRTKLSQLLGCVCVFVHMHAFVYETVFDTQTWMNLFKTIKISLKPHYIHRT